MHSSTLSELDILNNLVHDLRQPLGNIETSVFYLDLVLDHPDGRISEQLHVMEQQVVEAARLLTTAANRMRHLRAQREEDDGALPCAGVAESLALTNSAIAGVT
jgi:signal transduction histidine kinase